jgi:hypothetical protein
MKAKPSALTWLAVYAIWIILGIAAAWVAWQWNGAIQALAAWVITKPGLRPAGWNSATLTAVNRLSVLIFGALWLIGVMLLENLLRAAAKEARLIRESGRLALFLFITWLVGVGLPLLLSF